VTYQFEIVLKSNDTEHLNQMGETLSKYFEQISFSASDVDSTSPIPSIKPQIKLDKEVGSFEWYDAMDELNKGPFDEIHFDKSLGQYRIKMLINWNSYSYLTVSRKILISNFLKQII